MIVKSNTELYLTDFWNQLKKFQFTRETRRVDQRYFFSEVDVIQAAFERWNPLLISGMDKARQEAYSKLECFFKERGETDRNAKATPPLTTLYFVRSRAQLFLSNAELRETIAICESEIRKIQPQSTLSAETVIPPDSGGQLSAPVQPAPWQDPILFFRAQYLVDRLYLLTKSIKEREYARQLSARSVMRCLVLIIGLLCSFWYVLTLKFHAFDPLTWWIMFFGAIGAATSIMQRLQKAQVDDHSVAYLVRLRHGTSSLWISVGLGAIFALILALVICCGLAGSVFNKEILEFAYPKPGANPAGTTYFLLDFGSRAGLLQQNSSALLVAFISGFSERLVPDVLSRIEQEGAAAAKTSAAKPEP